MNPNVIKSKWFESYTKLKQISFPSSAKIIGVGSFEGCKELTHITVPSSVGWIKKMYFIIAIL